MVATYWPLILSLIHIPLLNYNNWPISSDLRFKFQWLLCLLIAIWKWNVDKWQNKLPISGYHEPPYCHKGQTIRRHFLYHKNRPERPARAIRKRRNAKSSPCTPDSSTKWHRSKCDWRMRSTTKQQAFSTTLWWLCSQPKKSSKVLHAHFWSNNRHHQNQKSVHLCPTIELNLRKDTDLLSHLQPH